MDKRLNELNDWLAGIGLQDYTIEPASADASFRRYFRVTHNGNTFIAMDAPPKQENMHPFIQVAAILNGLGLNVPRILKQDPLQGFLLLTDLGECLYLAELNENNVDQLYNDAMDALVTMQTSKERALPPYDRTLLMNEMELFRDWYLNKHIGVELSTRQSDIIDNAFGFLAASALAQPQVLVHRDYHSRNLMVCEHNPGILDFQDAVIGPLSYDLVSLLRDCYISWPSKQVQHWAYRFYESIMRAAIIEHIEFTQFLRWFDLMGIQRHLKATGIFARLNYRDHKPGYLNDIPRTLSYVVEVAKQYPELDDFLIYLTQVVPEQGLKVSAKQTLI